MSSPDDFDETAARRTANAPYSRRHPIPTVQQYQGNKKERQAVADAQVPDEAAQYPDSSENQGLLQSTKNFFHIGGPSKDESVDEENPYRSANRNIEAPTDNEEGTTNDHRDGKGRDNQGEAAQSARESGPKDSSEATHSTLDPRQKRKNMKHMQRDHASREVTDPVTHLKVKIHDTTDKELRTVPENELPPNFEPKNAGRSSTGSKSQTELDRETDEQQVQHSAMEKLFPPPGFDAAREEITRIYTMAFFVSMFAILLSSVVVLIGGTFFIRNTAAPTSWLSLLVLGSLLATSVFAAGGGVFWVLQGWLSNKIKGVWDDELWIAAREQEKATTDSPMPESTQWLNSLLSSVWPLINPDLFTSLADTLEDVMQASLPKLVRMISVEDLGQGSESIRILGVRWLPTGAAAQNVSEDGKATFGKSKSQQESDRKFPGQGELENEAKSDSEGNHTPNDGKETSKEESEEEGGDQNVAEGMEAEKGDFVNVEVAFSYRASKSGKSIKTKSKNAHLYLAFYLPGGIKLREHGLYSCRSSLPRLTVLSCMGRIARDCRNLAHATSTLSRSTILRLVYTYAAGTAQS